MRISDWSSDVCSSDLKGDEVANGIITAMGRVDIGVPIVIRLDGPNADEGRSILEPHLSEKLQMASTMVEAAETAVALREEERRGGKELVSRGDSRWSQSHDINKNT